MVLACTLCKYCSDFVQLEMNIYCIALNMMILPLCGDDFTVQFLHGGNMVNDGALEVYIGREETFKSHLMLIDLIILT